MKIENKFNIEQKVYLITDPDQLVRIVTALKILPRGVVYELSCGSTSSEHYDFEITEEKNVM